MISFTVFNTAMISPTTTIPTKIVMIRKRFHMLILFIILAFSLWNAALWAIILVGVAQTSEEEEEVEEADVTNDNDSNDTTRLLLAKGTAMALRLARNDFPQTIQNNTTTTNQVVSAAEWTIDVSQLLTPPCDVVYSFGVGTNDPWTNLMAQYCSNVYAFDPTVSTYDNPNVTFYPWGLVRSNTMNSNVNNENLYQQDQEQQANFNDATRSSSNNNTTSSSSWSHPIYGSAVPGAIFLTFSQVQARLELLSSHHLHPPKKIFSALKFDCEGCEYGAFGAGQVPPTKLLYTEFHFAVTLGMQYEYDVMAIAAVENYLSHCTVNQFRINRGFRRDRTVLPYLVQHGIPDGICCYEYAFTCQFG